MTPKYWDLSRVHVRELQKIVSGIRHDLIPLHRIFDTISDNPTTYPKLAEVMALKGRTNTGRYISRYLAKSGGSRYNNRHSRYAVWNVADVRWKK